MALLDREQSLWLAVRVGITLLGFNAGGELFSWDDSTLSAWGVIVASATVACVTTALVVGVIGLAAVGRDAHRWSRPSWRLRPFLGEPPQFFHATSFYFIAAGASAAIQAHSQGRHVFGAAALATAFGVGQYGGSHLAAWLHGRGTGLSARDQ